VVKNEYLAEASLTDGERSMLLFSAREDVEKELRDLESSHGKRAEHGTIFDA